LFITAVVSCCAQYLPTSEWTKITAEIWTICAARYERYIFETTLERVCVSEKRERGRENLCERVKERERERKRKRHI